MKERKERKTEGEEGGGRGTGGRGMGGGEGGVEQEHDQDEQKLPTTNKVPQKNRSNNAICYKIIIFENAVLHRERNIKIDVKCVHRDVRTYSLFRQAVVATLF